MLSQRAAYGTFILAGVANAVVKPASLAIGETGLFQAVFSGFGISAIVWMALAIGIWRLWQDGAQPCRPREVWPLMIASLGFLVPLASISWIVLGAACFLAAVFSASTGASKGLAITGLAAVRDPVSKLLLDVFAEPLLTLDAYASSILLNALGKPVEREGNIMSATADHALLIMSGCSSFTNLSLALLAWASILVGFSTPTWRLLLTGGAILGTAVVFLNTIRLSLMALSVDSYRIVHDAWGADVFLLLTSCLIVASVYTGLRHAR